MFDVCLATQRRYQGPDEGSGPPAARESFFILYVGAENLYNQTTELGREGAAQLGGLFESGIVSA